MLKPISTDDLLSTKIRLLMISHQLKIDQLNYPDLYTSVPLIYILQNHASPSPKPSGT